MVSEVVLRVMFSIVTGVGLVFVASASVGRKSRVVVTFGKKHVQGICFRRVSCPCFELERERDAFKK